MKNNLSLKVYIKFTIKKIFFYYSKNLDVTNRVTVNIKYCLDY